ncbi:hypothetical protein JANAI62_14120 [Jannaschia pagri]|uniref:DUF1674 domain-containing protein n=1 Tax=Jannaschia pagri TaxID=2829797 RepID=A0ABQ4NK67_9RHOB|nr:MULTISPECIES: DUF1674 domain-containing protein [unclassified Jannaschia]GIT90957.1 hypothetical protein JANAI61_14150 [Jannaschia sp. AI_61]GIT94789.1 hypothetical protein JANAI62_14120 [Jannaschia sp. AI_62]
MAERMTVDPEGLPQANPDAPACPTGNRRAEVPVTPLSAEAEAARRAALPEVARRALEEADARKAADLSLPTELGGRDGPEPVRYGDWELKGIAIDF